MLRIPHCLDNRLIDGDKFVRPKHRQHFTPQKHFFNVSGTHLHIYVYTIQGIQGISDFGRVLLMVKYTDITQNTYVQS
jgi:hypothetical protein